MLFPSGLPKKAQVVEYCIGLIALFAIVSLGGCLVATSGEESDSRGSSATAHDAPEPAPPAASDADIETTAYRWDAETAVQLAAQPLACVDRPQKRPRREGYLYQPNATLTEDYETNLAFYGCSDWHSAVNSTWTLVKVLKSFPDMFLAGLIREKLNHHLSGENLKGELAFFTERARPGFERPYGWAWLLKLYADLHDWDDEDGRQWAANLRPIAELLAERTVEYLGHLSHPMRVGTHANTAFSLILMLDYAKAVGNESLEKAVNESIATFFINDKSCPVAYEPSGSDFLSPCLVEAVLLGRVTGQTDFVSWFDEFLPGFDSPELEALLDVATVDPTDADEAESSAGDTRPGEDADPESERDLEERRLTGSKSHLIGLAFSRAAALERIADALPEGDARRETLRILSEKHGSKGFEMMYDTDYVGTHWLATYAVYWLSYRS